MNPSEQFARALFQIARSNPSAVIVGCRLTPGGQPSTAVGECVPRMTPLEGATLLAGVRLQLDLVIDAWAGKFQIPDSEFRSLIAGIMNEKSEDGGRRFEAGEHEDA